MSVTELFYWDIYLQVIVLIVSSRSQNMQINQGRRQLLGDKGWVAACHHCCVVPDDKDAQSLAKVTHHLVLVLANLYGNRYICNVICV